MPLPQSIFLGSIGQNFTNEFFDLHRLPQGRNLNVDRHSETIQFDHKCDRAFFPW